MHNNSKKDSDQSSAHSGVPCVVSCQSWWSSTLSQVPQPALSKNENLSMDSPHDRHRNVKQFSLQLQDRDSSSTQSTGQSHQEVVSMGACNISGQCISAQSGYGETNGQQVEGPMQSVLSLGTSDLTFPPAQVDYNHSMVCIPYPYDRYLGGFLAAYGPQAIIHPQIVGMAPARVPLPLSVADNEPIYVNAKQYRGILRRREYRAKLEAQNQLVRSRKPYLHESRHLHAMKRARGSGGRFLNTKTMQQSKATVTINGSSGSDFSDTLRPCGNPSESEVIQADTGNTTTTTTSASTMSCSDSTCVSNNGNLFLQPDSRFSGYHTQMGGTGQGGGGPWL